MTEKEAVALIDKIDDADLENLKYDHDYWCDVIVSKIWLVDGTELDDDTIEALESTQAGGMWKFDFISNWIH